MDERKHETRQDRPCGLPKSGNACALRTEVCCAKCGWNPEEAARRKALPLVRGEDGLYNKDIRPET